MTLEGLNLRLGRPTDYRAVSGGQRSATLAVLALGGQGGSVEIDGNLLPDPGLGLFPNHVLGIVAEGNIYQRGQYAMAPVYAGRTFRIVKDNVLFGSVISNEFCTTSAGNQTQCNAGQRAEVVYIRIPQENRPALLPSLRGESPSSRCFPTKSDSLSGGKG